MKEALNANNQMIRTKEMSSGIEIAIRESWSIKNAEASHSIFHRLGFGAARCYKHLT
jgi:hypothetical protein